MIKSVAIQGIKGSFHHIVSQQFFDQLVDVNEYLTFDKTVDSLLTRKSDAAIMAIENSIAGSIIPNYALIDTKGLHIVGEHYLDIQHHLMALPNQTINDIEEVYSHPMALLQCKDFFKQYPHIKLIEDKDTAEVAQRIQTHQIKNVAAIASQLAAQLFELKIISESIQTIKHNETRFVVVKTKNAEISEDEINKASVKFELDHKRGSLATILNVLSDCKLNLTKIQSLPKIETPWKYAFFVDLTFDSYKDFEKAKSVMTIMAQEFKVLGEYKNARQ
ncbi:prephenate dehydratase [uncultured Psychroserpens sp.]|uniref:prephenate dehydratase n=1 Tax=uncultured Psychroserpens sp. TaxID=255436 RepID=UPI00262586C7|nr:prephenate dehydratase [uncultured Psychroserpens sp.]